MESVRVSVALTVLFYNYLRKEVAVCVPGGQRSANIPHWPTLSNDHMHHCNGLSRPPTLYKLLSGHQIPSL